MMQHAPNIARQAETAAAAAAAAALEQEQTEQ
jgi:hypothetical protein